MAAHDHIIMFWKYPEEGRVKTRLIPALGSQGAAAVQLAMARHVLGWARRAARRLSGTLEVRYTGGSGAAVEQLIGADARLREQGDGDLGARLVRAFEDAFAAGSRRVVVIGADCPDATDEVLARAFAALDEHDAVIGPAADGGYYLLGLTGVLPEAFADIPWSTDRVLATTRARLDEAGVTFLLLEELRDVDRPADLPVWEQARRHPPPA